MIDSIIQYLHALLMGAKTKALFAFITASVLAVIGQNFLAYEILFILVIVDFITGFTFGLTTHQVSSRRASKTIHKLLIYFLLILSAHQLTRYLDLLIWLEQSLVIFMAITEMISIIENAHKLGIPIPTWITARLHQYLAQPRNTVIVNPPVDTHTH